MFFIVLAHLKNIGTIIFIAAKDLGHYRLHISQMRHLDQRFLLHPLLHTPKAASGTPFPNEGQISVRILL